MDDFVRMVRQFRFVWIRGRFGGGKTTLSLAVADKLVAMRAVRYVAVNFPLFVDVPCEVTTDAERVQNLEDACLLLDEAGQFLDVGSSPAKIKSWFSYLRKNNQIVLMASVLPVARFASTFSVQRTLNGLVFGLPAWWYRWHINNGDTKERGTFAWWYPQRVFGLFDSEAKLDDRWYIYDFQDEVSAVELGIAADDRSDADSGGHRDRDTVGRVYVDDVSGQRGRAAAARLGRDGYRGRG